MPRTPGHRWRLPAACAFFAALMLLSGRYTARVGYQVRWLSLQEGCLAVIWVDPLQKRESWPRYIGGVFTSARYRLRWLPALTRPLNLRYLYLPLWMPIPPLAARWAALVVRDRRRFRRGRCPACAYDLTGNTTGVCPECGAPALQSNPVAGDAAHRAVPSGGETPCPSDATSGSASARRS